MTEIFGQVPDRMRDVGSSDADETFIATGPVAPDISAAGHSVDSGVGPG